MAGAPLDSVNRQMPLLRASIGEDPAIAEVIRFGVITFSDVASTVLPLCDLSLVEAVPELTPQGRTSYAAAFHHLRMVIETDYHASRSGGDRWYRPAVIFISDGRPTDDAERWQAAHAPTHRRLAGSAGPTSWRSASATPTPACWPSSASPSPIGPSSRSRAPSRARWCRS